MPKKAAKVTAPAVSLRKGRGALHRQLSAALRRRIVSGVIPPGSRLPSSRALAQRLRISRNVVLQAYEELAAQGYLAGRVGSGTRVARARRDTYLWEVVAQGRRKSPTSRRAASLKRLVAEAKYPERVAGFAGVEALAHYLFDGGE